VEANKTQSNLETLLHQVGFLLNEHKISKQKCSKEFKALLNLIESNVQKYQVEEKVEESNKMKSVLSTIKKHLNTFEHEIGEDIAFLEEQYEGIKEALLDSNPQEAEELYEVLMKGEPLLDNEDFEQTIKNESRLSYDNFCAIVEDIKEVIADGNIDELIMYVESMKIETDSDDVDEDDEENECCEGESEGMCCKNDDVLKFDLFSQDENKKEECCGGKFACGDACKCSDKCGC